MLRIHVDRKNDTLNTFIHGSLEDLMNEFLFAVSSICAALMRDNPKKAEYFSMMIALMLGDLESEAWHAIRGMYEDMDEIDFYEEEEDL